MKSGFTLVEVVISMGLFSLIMAGLMTILNSSGITVKRDVEGARLMTEMSYALGTIERYCVPSSKIMPRSLLPAAGGAERELCFRRERDISRITPSVISDDIWYCVRKKSSGDIVLFNTETQSEEVLINSVFTPQILFSRAAGFEPAFLTVTVSGKAGVTGSRTQYSKMAGLRLWYAEAVR